VIKRVIDGAIAASGASETIDTGSGRTVNVQVSFTARRAAP